ncbi:efflux transporter outer membrane subunit [Flavobacterium sediminilitoris]|uniref:Efflux transporter outer membrane subunit n=1 Tax=Flavobacterium sediminilitoris TaxID=2024526 RepID=A0ABY4HR40_9FLAO|nr:MULTISPECIES: efflux transporter outer membrane subunit [Flavobacterium]UOX35075.1 efflux transporter outer membrane subunit [Flavobacterium sediminilitoris]
MKKQLIIKGSFLVAIMFLAQSCFVSKNYEAPKVETQNLYRTDQVIDSTSLAMVSWDKLFTDTLLQAYINEGLQNNLDMQIALQNMEAAEAMMKQGKAGYFPALNANATWTHQELSKNSQFGRLFNGSLDQYELSAKLSWEADIWGKIRSNKRASVAQYLQTSAAKQAIQTELIANIASLYYQMLATDSQIKVVAQTIENRNKSVEVIKALKEAGNVNEVAVQQTEAQKYATEIILKDLEYNLKVLENSFTQLLGKSPEAVERSSFDTQKIEANVKVGLPAYLLSKRPDVVAAELNFRNTFELTNVARSYFYPSLTLSATGGLQSLELKDWFNSKSIFANIITGLAQPIFNQRQNKTRLEVAKANQQKAYLQYEKALLIAGKEVSDALASYENESDKLTIREKQLDALTKAADYSDELLQYGLVNYLEVLTAKDNALNTEINYIDNKFKQMNAVIKLYKSLGGGN